ncbi:MAG TPA: L,D-transpeptidase [Epsilonproteobacteria bacterium]|nr:L,D-transpeptidase [Campylobacterota bacterium]
MRILFFFLAIPVILSASDRYGNETIPLSKTLFKVTKNGKTRTVNLSGQDFIVVSVREQGSEGRFYAVDRDATIWWSGGITSGVRLKGTPSGVFSILQKKRHHMSSEYPSEDGVNNMNYMLKFTQRGHALHQGSVSYMSQGCIHISSEDIPAIFNWATYKTKVVITRHSYMQFAQEDLRRIYF